MNDISMLYLGTVFGVLGLIIMIFRKSIGKIYDRMNLTDREKSHYKNFVVPMIGIIFLAASAVFLIIYFLNEGARNRAVSFIESYKYVIPFMLGIIAAGYGLFTIVIRIMKKEEKFFIKYAIMKRKYGDLAGAIMHIIGYTVVPLAVGIYFIIKYFNKLF